MAEAPINDYLDDYCLSEVLSYLVSIPDIINAQKVCRRWHELSRGLWKIVNTLSCNFVGRYCISKRGRGQHVVTSVNDLVEILNYCGPFILHFNFEVMDADPVTFASVLTTVSEHCKNLEDVYIRMPETPSTFRFRTLLNECMDLKQLYICHLTHDVEEDLSLLQSKNIKLKSFSIAITQWSSITGEFFKYLPVDLEKISFEGCLDEERNFSFSALKKFKNLQSFESIHTRWHEHSMEPKIIGEMKTLVRLSLRSTFYVSTSFDYLVVLVNLKELDLSYNTNLLDENVINIVNNCKQIEILNLNGCDSITDDSIANIGITLEKLKSFSIDDVNEITDEAMAELPSTIEHLSCKQCENVKVYGIINLMKKTRNCNMSMRIDHSADTDALIAGAREIIEVGTHHISINIKWYHIIVSLIKNETATPSLLNIERF